MKQNREPRIDPHKNSQLISDKVANQQDRAKRVFSINGVETTGHTHTHTQIQTQTLHHKQKNKLRMDNRPWCKTQNYKIPTRQQTMLLQWQINVTNYLSKPIKYTWIVRRSNQSVLKEINSEC